MSDLAKPPGTGNESTRGLLNTYRFLVGHPVAFNAMRLCGALLLVLSGYEIGH